MERKIRKFSSAKVLFKSADRAHKVIRLLMEYQSHNAMIGVPVLTTRFVDKYAQFLIDGSSSQKESAGGHPRPLGRSKSLQ